MKVVFELVWKQAGKLPTEGDGKERPFYWAKVRRSENTTILRMTRTLYNNQFPKFNYQKKHTERIKAKIQGKTKVINSGGSRTFLWDLFMRDLGIWASFCNLQNHARH